MTGRDVQIAGRSRFANPTTTWLEARSAVRIFNEALRRLECLDLQTQCKRKSRNPYSTIDISQCKCVIYFRPMLVTIIAIITTITIMLKNG